MTSVILLPSRGLHPASEMSGMGSCPDADLRAEMGRQDVTRSNVVGQEGHRVSSHTASSQAQVQPLPSYVALVKIHSA